MWLLEDSIRLAIERAITAGITPTAEQQATFAARTGGTNAEGEPRILTVAGSTAEITIAGVLTAKPDFLAWLFGGGNTTYAEVIAAVASAEQNEAVDNIVFAIDSPGGTVDGMFDAVAAIEKTTTPTKAVIHNVGASAAYALLSQADEVVANNRGSRIGSIGVAFSTTLKENEVIITSDAAPKKRPDLTTEEGKAVVRDELNAIHSIFAEAIADGRGTTVAKVNTNFGQGATLLADEALKRGMIDGIVGVPALKVVASTQSQTASSGTDNPESTMDLQTLMASHPETYAAAVKVGTTGERDRVEAHLVMGESSGDMKTAVAAIKNGDGMTMTLQATYMTAANNRSDIAAAADDDEVIAAAAAAAAAASEGTTEGEAVAAAVEAQFGITPEA